MPTIEQLRRQVRAHLATMDETPSDPGAMEAIQRHNDQLWQRVVMYGIKRKRQVIAGRNLDALEDAQPDEEPAPPPRPFRAVQELQRMLSGFIRAENGPQGIAIRFNDGSVEHLNEIGGWLAQLATQHFGRKIPLKLVEEVVGRMLTTGDHKKGKRLSSRK